MVGLFVAIKQHPRYLKACVVNNFVGTILLYSKSNLEISNTSSWISTTLIFLNSLKHCWSFISKSDTLESKYKIFSKILSWSKDSIVSKFNPIFLFTSVLRRIFRAFGDFKSFQNC